MSIPEKISADYTLRPSELAKVPALLIENAPAGTTASIPSPQRNPTMPEPGNAPAFDPVIFAYTRAQAIEDGVLVDVSDTAREAGFKIPVAVSRSVWDYGDDGAMVSCRVKAP